MDILQKDVQGQILILKLNRPEKHNCLNMALIESIDKAFTEAQDNHHIRAVVMIGNGKSFCAGADINRLAECDGLSGYEFASYGQQVMNRIARMTKPCIAALHGHVLGGGCELAMAFHLRFAHPDTLLGQPEVKLGVIPGYGGTQRLARLVGASRALDLCLSGRFVHAQEAQQMGLVNQIFEDYDAYSINYAQSLLALPSIALASVIESIQTGSQLPLSAGLELEALQFARTCVTSDKKEGVSAFLEKRKPHFTGC